MKTYWGSGGIAPCIIDPGTRWRLVVSFTPWLVYLYGIGGWVGPRAVLDMVVKGKIPSPHWKSNPRTFIIQPTA
jgi:hypothetical protein